MKRSLLAGILLLVAGFSSSHAQGIEEQKILEQYINRVSFGPGLRGVEAASRFYFDKPSIDLSLAEAAALAGIPRGPAVYDPARGTSRLLHRRDRVLDTPRDA